MARVLAVTLDFRVIPAQHWISKEIKTILFKLLLFWDLSPNWLRWKVKNNFMLRDLAKDPLLSFFHLTMLGPMTSFFLKSPPWTIYKPICAQPYKYGFYRKNQLKIGQVPQARGFQNHRDEKRTTTKKQSPNRTKTTQIQLSKKSRSQLTKAFSKETYGSG